jgi:hypothetical protein
MSKAGSFVVNKPLKPSEIGLLKRQAKFVAAVSNLGSKAAKQQLFVERRDQGDYAIRRGASHRASAVLPTQAQAIARAKEMNPDRPPLVERVRHTENGNRDKWRKA